MGKYYSKMLDEALNIFEHGNWITSEVLFNKAPEGFSSAIELLAKEGYPEESDYHYRITFKGQALINNGGFFRKYLRERANFYCCVVAAIASVLSLLIALIALFL